MAREIKETKLDKLVLDLKDADISGNLLQCWLKKQAKTYEFQWMLAYANDGVLWGRFELEDSKQLSLLIPNTGMFPNANIPTLSSTTLQRCHLFGQNGELLLWKQNQMWKARTIIDHSKDSPDGEDAEYMDESYYLWGTVGEKGQVSAGFTFVVEGDRGIQQVLPIAGLGKTDHAKLHVRHYIEYSDTGICRIAFTRLRDVSLERTKKKRKSRNMSRKISIAKQLPFGRRNP